MAVPARTTWSIARRFGIEIVLLAFFAVQAFRHLWIADDGYIYLAYVRNFTENHWGPVFNAHQHVEAYTSFGWFWILSVLNFLRPRGFLDLRKLTILTGLVMSIGAVAWWMAIERRAANRPKGSDDLVVNIPLAVLAGTFAIYSFATSGLETPLEYVFLSAFVYYVFRDSEQFWIAAALIAASPLIRPDYALFGAMLFVRYVRRRGAHPLRLLAVALAPIAAVEVFRIMYYATLLPNTYYAKTNVPYGLHDGLNYLREFTMSYGAQWLALAAVPVVVADAVVRRHADDPTVRRPVQPFRNERQFLLVCAALYTGYVLNVGGDFMHGRFWIPVVFTMLGVLAGVGTRAVALLRNESVTTRRMLGSALVAGFFAVSLTGEPVANAMSPVKGTEFRGIDNQERALQGLSPNIHHLFGDATGTWGKDGIALRALAARLGTELGTAVGGIGEISYTAHRARGDVFIYDTLSLTNPPGAHLDMEGVRLRRVGAAKVVPQPLMISDPRVDFAPEYFPGYGTTFLVRYGDFSGVLVNFDLLPALERAGVVSPARVDAMRSWIRTKLAAPTLDANLVYMLDTHYHANDDIRATLDRLHDVGARSVWARWLAQNAKQRALLAPRAPTGSFFHRLRVALDRHRVKPIPYLKAAPDPVPNPLA